MLWMKVFPNVVKAKQNQNGMVSMTDDFVKAFDLWFKICARRAKLNGLDAPAKVAPVDGKAAADAPELKHVINIFNILRKENPAALDAVIKASEVIEERR